LSEAPFHSAQFELRYDDLTQHGHIKQSALQLVLGRVGFELLWTRHPLYDTRLQGIVPIMSRMVLEAEPVPVSFSGPVEGRGRIELAHEPAADGGVHALFMNSYGELWGPRSQRRREPAGDAGARPASLNREREHVLIGRAFGEHVFTKPFAKPGNRKVLSFDVPGHPSVPSQRHARVRAEETCALPDGAEWLDNAFQLDAAPIVFGLTHTDANQHVNSLVYSRVFEEAALRRLAEHGQRGLLGCRIELNYRKPCFAGDRMLCSLRSYARHGEFGATGFLAAQGDGLERSHCSFDLRLRRVGAAVS
jgi:hypothetical protein